MTQAYENLSPSLIVELLNTEGGSLIDKSQSVIKLDSFGYPSIVNKVILQFKKITTEVLKNFDPGILLVGSTARGELSWSELNGHVELFSDLEFIIAVTSKNSKIEFSLKKEILELEKKFKLGRLFHIDYTVIKWAKLSKVEKKFFVFESKKCGVDLCAKRVRSKLPDVNINNINWKELNEVLLHRMNSMLCSIPSDFLNSSKLAEKYYTLNIAKNTLDITTWLHPYESDKLLAGFAPRLEDWRRNLKNKKLHNFFSINDIEFLESCLLIRKNPLETVDQVGLLEKSLELFNKAIIYCKIMNDIKKKESIEAKSVSIKLFDEYKITKRIKDAAAFLKNIDMIGSKKITRNIICVRKGIQINFCFYMLTAATQFIRQQEHSSKFLSNAEKSLGHLMAILPACETGFEEKWHMLYSHYIKFVRVV